MEYKIRKALPEDIIEIVNLCAEHAEYEKIPFDPEGKTEKLAAILFTEDPKLFCFIVENGNGILGYATYTFDLSTWDAQHYINMDCLYLRSLYRGHGIGEVLMKHIAEHGREKNCHLMQWITPPFNTRAIKFYYRIGATSREKTKLYLNEETIKKLLDRK